MEHLFRGSLAIIVIVLVFSSCTNHDVNPTYSVVGTWRWVKNRGGITGNIEHTPASVGHQLAYIFKSDLSFIQTDNGDTIQQSTYTLKKDTSIRDHDAHDFIIIHEKYYTSDIHGQDSLVIIDFRCRYEFSADTLLLDHDAYDSYDWWYVRAK
jgi:hypothetical protein